MPPTTVSVKILDKDYQVACQPEEVDALTASARYLDKQMKTIRDTGKVLGLDRVAVMAALNVTHDYLKVRGESTGVAKDVDKKLGELLTRVSRALADARQLSL
jgi:cell division protein ZapA